MVQIEQKYFPFRDLFVVVPGNIQAQLEALQQALLTQSSRGVWLRDFEAEDLGFLEKFSARHLIQSLSFQFCRQVQLPKLSAFPNLQELNLHDEQRQEVVDLAPLVDCQDLRYLYLNWGKGVLNLQKLASLKQLFLRETKAKSIAEHDLPTQLTHLNLDASRLAQVTGLAELDQLQSLSLLNGKKLTSLSIPAGLQALNLAGTRLEALNQLDGGEGLRELGIARAPAGFSLAGVSALTGLEKLSLSSTKQVSDVSQLSLCAGLQSLLLDDCQTIPDLNWIERLPQLWHFCFYGTVVVDGDLTPLFRAPKLKVIGFDNKKHYSHNLQALDRHIASRQQIVSEAGTRQE